MQGCKGIEEKRMAINKALVHRGLALLLQMFFSDVSKRTMFQSLNSVSQKGNDECLKIAGNNNSHVIKPNTN